MFVSPPPPSGSTLLYGTEAAIHNRLILCELAEHWGDAMRAAETTVCAA